MRIQKKEYKPEDSKYYGAKIAKKGDIIKILDEAKLVEHEYEGVVNEKWTCNIEVTRNKQVLGKSKEFAMNYTYCAKPLMEAYTDDTSNWIGKTARVIIMPTPKGDSNMIMLDIEEQVEDTTFRGTEEPPF